MTAAAGRGLLVRLSIGALAVAAAETALIACRTPSGIGTLNSALAVLAASSALALGVVILVWAIALGLGLSLSEWRRRSGRTFGFETNLALLGLLPPVLAVSTAAGRFFFGAFSNVELAALLSGLVTLATAAVALLVSVFLRGLLERAQAGKNERTRSVSLSAIGFYFSVWAVLSQRVLGLRQIDVGLALAALSGAVGFWLGRYAERRVPWSVLGLLAGFVLGLGVTTRSATPAPCASMARHGSWSKAAVTRARLAFDADRDGFSPWFSGGDCDDGNPAVNSGRDRNRTRRARQRLRRRRRARGPSALRPATPRRASEGNPRIAGSGAGDDRDPAPRSPVAARLRALDHAAALGAGERERRVRANLRRGARDAAVARGIALGAQPVGAALAAPRNCARHAPARAGQSVAARDAAETRLRHAGRAHALPRLHRGRARGLRPRLRRLRHDHAARVRRRYDARLPRTATGRPRPRAARPRL